MNEFILITLLSVAAMYDLNYAKIPNRLILAGLVTALISLLYGSGSLNTVDVYDRLLGMSIPLLAGVVIYAFGILGAGDIKLLCVIGAFLGVRRVLGSMVYALSIGALMGGAKMIYMIKAGWLREYTHKRVTIRFAVCILLGTLGEIITLGIV